MLLDVPKAGRLTCQMDGDGVPSRVETQRIHQSVPDIGPGESDQRAAAAGARWKQTRSEALDGQ
jgi:hypothetical protein